MVLGVFKVTVFNSLVTLAMVFSQGCSRILAALKRHEASLTRRLFMRSLASSDILYQSLSGKLYLKNKSRVMK